MSETVAVIVNGTEVQVPRGATAAAALMVAEAWRRSISGELRGPLCGMGICYECRAKVDGMAQVKTCQVAVVAGMQIETE